MSQIFVLKTLSGELRGTYFFGASSRIRTDDLLITNQLLWPSELSKHIWRREWDSNPRTPESLRFSRPVHSTSYAIPPYVCAIF